MVQIVQKTYIEIQFQLFDGYYVLLVEIER